MQSSTLYLQRLRQLLQMEYDSEKEDFRVQSEKMGICLPVGCSCARPHTGLTFLCPLIKLQEPSPQPTIAHHTMCHVLFQPST